MGAPYATGGKNAVVICDFLTFAVKIVGIALQVVQMPDVFLFSKKWLDRKPGVL